MSWFLDGTNLVVLGLGITAFGTVVSGVGAFIEKRHGNDRLSSIADTNNSILAAQVNAEHGLPKIVSIRENNLLKEISRSRPATDFDQIIENSKNIGTAEKELREANADSVAIARTRHKALLLPVLLAYQTEFVRQLEVLRARGIVEKIEYPDIHEINWMEGGGDLAQAKTTNGTLMHIGFRNIRFSTKGVQVAAQVYIPSMQESYITDTEVGISKPSGERLILKGDEFDKPANQPLIISAIRETLMKSIEYQLKSHFAR